MKVVVLDRDGVINHDSDSYIKSAAEWHAIPGSLEAIAKLNQNGWSVYVATNQSAIGRDICDYQAFSEVTQKMRKRLADVGGHIDGLFFCPHAPNVGCDCRKPQPGMLTELKERLQRNIDDAWFIGDSERDLEAAEAALLRPGLVLTGNGKKTAKNIAQRVDFLSAIPQANNLQEFVSKYLI